MKRSIIWVVAALLSFSMAGCAAVKKKFTRKKKQEVIRPQVYDDMAYVKPYSNKYYYVQNFNHWKLWHEEAIKFLEGNRKRRDRALSDALQHLKQMQTYLSEEKAQELGVEIEKLTKAKAGIQSNKRQVSSRARFTMDQTLLSIRSNFEPSDMDSFIIKDEIQI